MLKKLVELKENNSQDVANINNKINQINKLIDKYNNAGLEDKAELLMELYQSYHSLDASISYWTLEMENIVKEYLNTLHTTFIDDLRKEFQQFDVSFHKSAINAWDIKNIKSNQPIPSSTRFSEMTLPSFWERLFGYTTSPELRTVIRILEEMDQSSIKKNNLENYHKLSQLKISIRELIANESLSTTNEQFLKNLIATLNGRIYNILESNPVLKDQIILKEPSVAKSLANCSTEYLSNITAYLDDYTKFDESECHLQFDKILPGLENYKIKFLGGQNTKNYLLTDSTNQEQFVLNIAREKGNSRRTIERLKNTDVNKNITHVFSSRERFESKNGYIYSVKITEFCAKGDVLSYGNKIKDKEEKYATATNLYGQMTEILLNFSANNALFPDMKPTNFLVTEVDKLLIADTKSFIDLSFDTQKTKIIFSLDEVEKSQYYLYTEAFEPPELLISPNSEPDKHHAFLLGYSLYLFLTDKTIPPINEYKKNDFFNFNLPIFETKKGKAFKELIEGLIEENPNKRLGLQGAKQKLNEIQYGIKIENSPFKSKTEAYFYTINHLIELQSNYKNPTLTKAISDLKILVENHEQNPQVAATILDDCSKALGSTLNSTEISTLNNIAFAIKTSAYEQSPQEKYENLLARRFESQMQIELLQNPTKSMMYAVGHVSKSLLDVFSQMENNEKMSETLKIFVANLSQEKNPFGFGSQTEEVDIKTIKKMLEKNDPQDLNQIMFIHFFFAKEHMRLINEIQLPNQNMPVGKLKEIIEEYNNGEFKKSPMDFFKNMDDDKLCLIVDKKICSSKLYTAEYGRGRNGGIQKIYSSQMGIMLVNQSQEGLPKDKSSWTPDAKYQAPNFDSIYVRDLTENDAVYVAGPSGMTSLFLNIMELYGNFPDVKMKQNYLAAISAYMVSGGLHSLHEVIGPAQYSLDLVPGYHVIPPEKDKIAPPPNFHQFYQQQMDIDPDFKKCYESGWDKIMILYAKEQSQFIHKSITKIDETSSVQKITIKTMPTKGNTGLNSEKAAENLINVLNKALREYHNHITKTSPILLSIPGQDDVDAIITLLEKARNETTFEGVTQVLQDFFTNKLTSQTGKTFSNPPKPNAYSFTSFFLNELKNNPDLVKYINKNHPAKNELNLDPQKNYILSNNYGDRVNAFNFFKSMEINKPQIKKEILIEQTKYKDELIQLKKEDEKLDIQFISRDKN